MPIMEHISQVDLIANPTSKTVFISYAREDVQSAERLYKDLEDAGLKPWLDKEAILPGYKWKLAIYQAIKNSRFFIPLFSSRSAEKIGYVQNELKYAIDVSKSFPEKDVYIIPARLDDCKIPDEIETEIQSVDLFPDWNKGINDIFKTFKERGFVNRNGPDSQTVTFKERGFVSRNGPDSQTVTYTKKDEEWQTGLSEEEWNDLLTSIYDKTCIPFIGLGTFTKKSAEGKPLISLSKNIIENWKHRYPYPFEDLYNLSRAYILEDPNQLARLAQFLDIERSHNEKLMYPKKMLKEILNDIELSGFYSQFTDKSPYDVLANLDLPIYMTTNYDKYMEASLSNNQTKIPQSEFCRWNEDLIKYVKALGIPSVFNKRDYEPTAEKPLVYHILGVIEQPKSMVLTEREYLEFVIELTKNEEWIPAMIRKKLPRSSLLFVGYSLDDINFRAIFHGFLHFLSTLSAEERKISIAVQIPPTISNKGQIELQKHLDEYTKNMFQIRVYWDNPSGFMVELDKRWQDFKKMRFMETGR
jgi:hypothetical protein